METLNTSSDYTVLVVDDDPTICDFLTAALETRYKVTSTLSGAEAIELIGGNSFDLVVTDLVLPDATGLEVLAYAKSRDDFTEVLMVTGNASVDTATAAINNGVGSYMLKPFSVAELRGRAEKMLASRAFHLKSLQLMKRSDLVDDAVKGHVDDLNSLYHFTRKLMLTLEISEVMRIMLEEVNVKANAEFCTIEVCLPDYKEVYSMPRSGEMPRDV
ncbi:MAG: response regulator, partial [Chitinispirillales bacterium]|nr:response regulator [Chitinispirillales bacterium]